MDLDAARKTFFLETEDLLNDMEQGLLDLEQQADPGEAINRLFRAAHTIKGNSGIFGFDHVGSFAHRVESVLDGLRNGGLGVTTALVELLLRCRDHMAELVAAAAEGRDTGEELLARSGALIADLDAMSGTGKPAAPAAEAAAATGATGEETVARWHVEWDIGPDMASHGLDPLALLRYLGQKGRIEYPVLRGPLPEIEHMDPEKCYASIQFDYVSVLPLAAIRKAFEFFLDQSELRIEARESSSREKSPSSGAVAVAAPAPSIVAESGEHAALAAQIERQTRARSQAGAVIRVDAARLDQLINLVGELVIAGATTNVLANQLGNEQLLESHSAMTRLVEDIRDSALNLRMVPIADTFARFQRVVRDVSHDLSKEIRLVISGGETELDKTVVEKIGDPLMHLVRNAMDHGIEPPEERVANGKPREGTVGLNAFHDSGSIVIQVVDDGRGLDVDKLLAKAQQHGLVNPSQSLSRQEILRFAFEPGLSTANKVTNLSGRGVGLDVVKRNIEALRGSVEVESETGKGTRVSIRLPLTLAIIDGFRVGVAGNSYVIPLDTVIECIEIENEADVPRHAHYINLRGEVLPFLRLRELFREVEPSPDGRENIVVVSYAGQKAGLVVDELLGEYQTVIKPLGRLFKGITGLSGATILGSGDVAVILDVAQLIHAAVDSPIRTTRMAAGM